MDKIELYNFNKIVKIIVMDKRVNKSYIYKPSHYKKRWFGKDLLIGEQFYEYSYEYSYEVSRDEILKRHLIEDNVVYYSPYITLIFEGGVKKTLEFYSFEDALEYLDILKSKFKIDEFLELNYTGDKFI